MWLGFFLQMASVLRLRKALRQSEDDEAQPRSEEATVDKDELRLTVVTRFRSEVLHAMNGNEVATYELLNVAIANNCATYFVPNKPLSESTRMSQSEPDAVPVQKKQRVEGPDEFDEFLSGEFEDADSLPVEGSPVVEDPQGAQSSASLPSPTPSAHSASESSSSAHEEGAFTSSAAQDVVPEVVAAKAVVAAKVVAAAVVAADSEAAVSKVDSRANAVQTTAIEAAEAATTAQMTSTSRVATDGSTVIQTSVTENVPQHTTRQTTEGQDQSAWQGVARNKFALWWLRMNAAIKTRKFRVFVDIVYNMHFKSTDSFVGIQLQDLSSSLTSFGMMIRTPDQEVLEIKRLFTLSSANFLHFVRLVIRTMRQEKVHTSTNALTVVGASYDSLVSHFE